MVCVPSIASPKRSREISQRNFESGGLYRKSGGNSTGAGNLFRGLTMRVLAATLFAALLLAADPAAGQEALSSAAMAWHGVQMGPEQVFEGDYAIDYQTSVFRPTGAAAGDPMWLAGWEDRPGDNGGLVRRYHLRFIGRQTAEPGRYGGLGAYKHTVLITRLISARLLITQPQGPGRP